MDFINGKLNAIKFNLINTKYLNKTAVTHVTVENNGEMDKMLKAIKKYLSFFNDI
jgi:hypothetical protein